MPWKEISKKSLVEHGVDPTESVPKQKRGFLANLASLLNDAEAISGHRQDETGQPNIASLRPQKTLLEEGTNSKISLTSIEQPTTHADNGEKKDVIDVSSIKDISRVVKDSSPDYAPIFAMYHGKVVELGKLPESAFKKPHPVEHETNTPMHDIKEVTGSKRYIPDSISPHKLMENSPIKRDFQTSSDQLRSYLKNLGEDNHEQTGVTKDSISFPDATGTASKNDLINHVKSVVLDDGKIISINSNNNNRVSEASDTISSLTDIQQKFVVNNEGNVEPLVKQKSITADAVTRDTLGSNDGQKTVTLTVDVLKNLLKKTDSKVSLAQLLNKPADERSNTQEDEDPGTIEDFAAGGLKAHNDYRVKHHDDGLIWSDELAAKAQKLAEALADKKTLEIAKDLEKDGMGENVAKVWATFKNAGEAATKMWYSQSENYRFDDPHLDENTGQFAQVVWKSTKELGMGVAKSIDDVNNKYVYVTALYRPPGNIEAVLRDNVLPTGNNTQDVYSTFFKRAGVIVHEPIIKRSKVIKKAEKTQNSKRLGKDGSN